jgi:uncharacterized protein (DUF2062 family)
MSWLRRKWRSFHQQFISLKGSPESIARAFAIGFWVGWFPIIGTHSALSFVAGLLFRANLPAVYLGSWICNPLSIPPMLYLEYQLGARLIGGADLGQERFADLTISQMFHLGWEILLPMILGGAILGTLNAVIGYYPIKQAVIRVRRRTAHLGEPKAS